MKTPFKLSIMTIAMAFLMPISSYSQSYDNDKSGLVGTAWNMVQNINDNAHSHRTMYFKKDFTFESRNTDVAYLTVETIV